MSLIDTLRKQFKAVVLQRDKALEEMEVERANIFILEGQKLMMEMEKEMVRDFGVPGSILNTPSRNPFAAEMEKFTLQEEYDSETRDIIAVIQGKDAETLPTTIRTRVAEYMARTLADPGGVGGEGRKREALAKALKHAHAQLSQMHEARDRALASRGIMGTAQALKDHISDAAGIRNSIYARGILYDKKEK